MPTARIAHQPNSRDFLLDEDVVLTSCLAGRIRTVGFGKVPEDWSRVICSMFDVGFDESSDDWTVPIFVT